MKTKKKSSAANTHVDVVEGEGSYSATRRYNEGLERLVQAGKSELLAKQAKEALAGPERAELERAERAGKKGNPKTTNGRG